MGHQRRDAVFRANYSAPSTSAAYEFVLTYTAFFTLVGLLGTNWYVIKSDHHDHGLVGPLVLNGLMLKLAMSAALSLAAFGSGWRLGSNARSSCCSTRHAW